MAQFTDKIMNIEVLNMPVGKAFLLTAAFGLANGLSYTIDRVSGGRIPPVLSQVGVAAALENIQPIKRFLGADLVDLTSVAALTAGINSQFNVSGLIVNAVDKVLGFIPGLSTPALAPPTPTPATESGSMSGYQMGEYKSMGQARQQLPNVDDVDLALLSARGYQAA